MLSNVIPNSRMQLGFNLWGRRSTICFRRPKTGTGTLEPLVLLGAVIGLLGVVIGIYWTLEC